MVCDNFASSKIAAELKRAQKFPLASTQGMVYLGIDIRPREHVGQWPSQKELRGFPTQNDAIGCFTRQKNGRRRKDGRKERKKNKKRKEEDKKQENSFPAITAYQGNEQKHDEDKQSWWESGGLSGLKSMDKTQNRIEEHFCLSRSTGTD